MMQRVVIVAVVALVFLNLISLCLSVGPTNPTPKYSTFLSPIPATKLRIESFAKSSVIDLCLAWRYGSTPGNINSTRFIYDANGLLRPAVISNPLPSTDNYMDVDVADRSFDCNIAGLEVSRVAITGEAVYNTIAPANSVAIGFSFLNASFEFGIFFRNTDGQIPPFSELQFTGDIETRRLTANTTLVATEILGGQLFVASVAATSTKFNILSQIAVNPISISAAVFSETNWVVCIITESKALGCVFSGRPNNLITITTPQLAPTMVAISFIDCRNIVYVVTDEFNYFLNLLDVTDFTPNLGGYESVPTTGISALHLSTTDKLSSVVISNASGVYLDLFDWSYETGPCDAVQTPETTAPSSTPQDVSQAPGSNPDSNVQQPNAAAAPSLDPVALGVGLAVPLAVLGVGVFLLVFFLRKRNKKKKAKQDVTQANPVNDIGNAPPSAQPPSDTGVYRNLPSNMTSNNTYTSLGNVANDSFATASAAIELPDIDKRLHIPYKSLVFIKEIGAGSYGKVFLGEWRGAKVAIKVNNQITDVDGFLAEAKLTLGIAPHPNLVQTFGVSLDGPNPCIVLEYCGGGSLDQVLYDTNQTLPVEKQREYAMKIAYGLLHLHNNNIVHRDLAARNILLTNDQQPKISDFGMSRIIQEENSKGHTKTNFGPIRWMAPESLRDRSYSVKSDVWTYGVVVNEILSRQEPHVNEDQLSIAVKIRDQAATPEIPSNGDPVLVEVIHKCLKAESKDRPTMEELCQFMRTKMD